MPWQDGTLTAEDVGEYVQAPVDARMVQATDTARAWAQDRRCNTDPLVLWSNPHVHEGGMVYAAMRWRSKASPVGFASYEQQDVTDYTEYAVAQNLVGLDPVIA
jgi:hypothetical protein